MVAWSMLPATCVVLALAGCGGSNDAPAASSRSSSASNSPAPSPPTGPSSARPAQSPVVRSGRLRGRLIVTPRVADAGGTLQLTVQNLGEVTMTYGLPNRPQRRVNGRWRDATKDIYGTSEPVFTRQALHAQPGTSSRPRAERILLPDDLEPGTYRILRDVHQGPVQRGHVVTLRATFRVR